MMGQQKSEPQLFKYAVNRQWILWKIQENLSVITLPDITEHVVSYVVTAAPFGRNYLGSGGEGS